MKVLDKILDKKVIAVIRCKHEFDAVEFIETLVESGINCIEITMTTPNALSIIRDLNNEFGDSIVLGAGTVLNSETVKKTLDIGAEFIVTPLSDLDLIRYAKQQNTTIMAGAFSPTEIYNCYMAGADIIKVFPANVVGISYFKSLSGPFPKLPLMPSGGVTLENVGDWIQAGAKAVSIGGSLIDDDIILKKDFARLKSNSKKVMASLNNTSK